MGNSVLVRAIEQGDQESLAALLLTLKGSKRVARLGRVDDVSALPGFLALDGGEIVGVLVVAAAICDVDILCEIVGLLVVAAAICDVDSLGEIFGLQAIAAAGCDVDSTGLGEVTVFTPLPPKVLSRGGSRSFVDESLSGAMTALGPGRLHVM